MYLKCVTDLKIEHSNYPTASTTYWLSWRKDYLCCFVALTNTHFTKQCMERANHLVHKARTKKWEQDVKLDNASPLCWKHISWPNKHIAIWPDAAWMTPLGSVCHSSFVLGLTWSVSVCVSTYVMYYGCCRCGTRGAVNLCPSFCLLLFLLRLMVSGSWLQQQCYAAPTSPAQTQHDLKGMKDERNTKGLCDWFRLCVWN